MSFVLIIHRVDDYQAWKQVFDGAAAMRKGAGEKSYRVLRDQHVPNKVVHFAKWNSLDNARAFFESSELAELRRRAGVHAPEFLYLTSLENGTL